MKDREGRRSKRRETNTSRTAFLLKNPDNSREIAALPGLLV